MFTWLYNILGTLLTFFSKITGGNYALALIFYALLFKIVFLPLTIKQQKNQIAMAKLTPKIQLIKAKYKGRNDQVTLRKQQEEIMQLQQKEGYSPFSGCLPMIFQMILIVLLYTVIRNPLTYIVHLTEAEIEAMCEITGYAAGASDQIGLIGTIAGLNDQQLTALMVAGIDINAFPNFNLFGLNLALTPSIKEISWLVVIPVLAALSQWFTMWISRKVNGNPAQLQGQDAQGQMSMKMMDFMMPAMTLFFAFGFSGMLGLYWIYQSILAVIQTLIIAKVMPLPKFTEEEIKEMRKAEKEAEKAQREAIKSQPKYKSLHYIDEDDYDELPEVKTNTAKGKTNSSQDIPEIKD